MHMCCLKKDKTNNQVDSNLNMDIINLPRHVNNFLILVVLIVPCKRAKSAS